MPLLPFKSNRIEIALSDRVYNDTIIKQKATFTSLIHTQNEIESRAIITILVTMYANDNGEFGTLLSGPGFQPYQVNLVADNNCIVNAESGEIIAVRTTESTEIWLAKAELLEENAMFQGDFFEMLRDTQPIRIGELIKLHITQADSMNKFK